MLLAVEEKDKEALNKLFLSKTMIFVTCLCVVGYYQRSVEDKKYRFLHSVV